MKIAFYTSHLCLRGTTVAIYDYARYNQEILGNESVIIYDKPNQYNDESVKNKFESICKVNGLEGLYSLSNLENCLEEEKCDAVYIVRKGFRSDGPVPTVCKTLIHAISMAPPTEKHGDIWAYASKWLYDACGKNSNTKVVPYMVDLPDINEDMRSDLGIPRDALVFGRHGGLDSWNISYSDHVILKALETREDLFFLFQNTPIKFKHPRIIHIPASANMSQKVKFINTCDAMIHARHEGESFGLACAEFSIRNKPVITWNGSLERSHIDILGEKAHMYSNAQEMFDNIVNFKRKFSDYNCYREYEPEKIMKVFNDVFLG